MSYINCRCGNVLHDITDGIRYKGFIISDREQFDLYDFADEMIESDNPDRELLAMTFRSNISLGDSYIRMKEIFQCPQCGRILIETTPGEFAVFTPEEHTEKNLLDYGAQKEKKHYRTRKSQPISTSFPEKAKP